MKKIVVSTTLAASLLASGIPAFAQGDFLQNGTKEIESVVKDEMKELTKYLKFYGEIIEINKDGDSSTILVENPDTSSQMYLIITDEVLSYNSATTEPFQDYKKGLFIEGYYDKNKPILMIYPPRIEPEIVIVHDRENIGQVKIGKFNDDLISVDNQLKIFLDDKTILLNEKGDKIEETELYNKELIVFYTFSTKSIPAHTTPSKIIALDNLSEVDLFIQEDHFYKDGAKMIPLRKVAESLGYEVTWKNYSVLVEKPNRSLQIKILDKAYKVNEDVNYFKVTPELKDGKTYVSEEFLEVLTAK